jgi:hypothetical protein
MAKNSLCLCPPDRLEAALQRVLAEIHAGLRHGYFEYTVTCEIVNQGKRKFVLRAGKHYQFVIGAKECESGGKAGDPHHEGAGRTNS